MKTKTTTKQAARLPKLPKARVRYCSPNSKTVSGWKGIVTPSPCAVIPCHTVTEARALIRVAGFFAMGEGERFEAAVFAADAACKKAGLGNYSNIEAAEAILTLIASGGARK